MCLSLNPGSLLVWGTWKLQAQVFTSQNSPLMLMFLINSYVFILYTNLQNYLQRTYNVRGSETRLFLTFRLLFHVASRNTLRRWTKDLLQAAGIDLTVFFSPPVRSAASSKAAQKLPLSTILSTVSWSSESTFARFYRKPLGNPCPFAEAVLSTDR